MQIPKCLILCAAICLCPLLNRADTEAQARAREALRGKIAELDGAAAPNATPAAATETKPLPVAPAPAPVPKVKLAPAPATAPAGTTRTATKRLDPETRRMANEKLQEKIRELEGQQSLPAKPRSSTDSDATQQAREQLRRKVAELTPTETRPSETVVAKPTPVVEQPVAKPPPPKVAPTSAKSDGQVENAREALRKKIAEIEAQKPVATPTPPPVVAAPTQAPAPPPVVAAPPPPPVVAKPAPAPTPPPVVSKSTPTPAVSTGAEFAAVPAIPDSAEIAKAREEMHKRIAELESQPKPLGLQPKPSPTPPKPVAFVPPAKPNVSFEPVEGIAPGTSAVAIYEPGKTSAKGLSAKERERMEAERAAMRTPASFNTVEVPPPAISAAKAEKLAELLRKYKTDEITPEQYHKERAKVLAEP